MKERPIIFSGPMIRAVMEKRKTQTRRIVPGDWWRCLVPDDEEDRVKAIHQCPYGVPGDRLWAKETWAAQHDLDTRKPSEMLSADARIHYAATEERGGLLWRSPLLMPRWASRLTLEITEVRVQRLQDISNEDAIAEGARHFPDLPSKNPYKQDTRWSLEEPASVDDCMSGPKWAFANYVNKIHAKRQPEIWDANPWVWAISFSVVS